ncbi:uncharacterized protein LOC108116340 [Drosophila eugracilis]|uniref:uncharacterized protein LOC108116340 n=1 Tax=Drosophila eugracilis TaxID=29029 RepID=UPI0007E760DF|nr:uncharacterized protein LOC108116340 [Drosophila eugracilis]
MVYLNILLGLGVVLVTSAVAIYMSRPSYQQTQPHRYRNRRDEDEDEFDNGESLHRNFRDQRLRRSIPGDRCAVCLQKMNSGNMQPMKCGHALDNACFQEYRYLSRNCPLCNRTVNLSLPGDSCAICFDPLIRQNMKHLRCQHALHGDCFEQFMDSGANSCPLCREQL